VTYQPNSKKQEVNFYNYNHSHSDEPSSRDLSHLDLLLFLFYKKAGKNYKLTIEDELRDEQRIRSELKYMDENWGRPPKKDKQIVKQFFQFGFNVDDCIKADN